METGDPGSERDATTPMNSSHKHAEDLMRQIAAGVSVATGAQLFDWLVKHLAIVLDADIAYIAELLPGRNDRVRTLSVFEDKNKAPNFEYDLQNTPCEGVVGKTLRVYGGGIQRVFPSDALLRRFNAEAYVGAPLFSSKEEPLGLLVTVFRRPLPDTRFAASALEIFAVRASAELERERFERKLRENERRYSDFISRTSEGVWRAEFDPPIPANLPREEQLARAYRDGRIAECNEAYARIRGFESPDQLAGKPFKDVFAPADWIAMTRTPVDENTRFELRYTDHQGNLRYSSGAFTAIVEGGMIVRVWGVTRDITESRRTEEALRESERRYRELLETVHLAAMMLDANGRVTFCNEALLRMIGLPASEVVGKNWFESFVPEEERGEQIRQFQTALSESKAQLHSEGSILTRDGGVRRMAWDNTVLRDPEKRPAGMASLGRDITEQRAVEDQYRQSQKLESIGRLAGGIAHDFNNLLTIINGYAELVLATLKKTDPLYTSISEIASAGQKAAALTQQLLAFSRRQVLEPKVLDLNSVISGAERMLRRLIGEDVNLDADLDPSAGFVRADAGQIHQLLMNLALNARDAMPSGGTLTIRSGEVEIGEQDAGAHPGVPPGRYATITVADTGTGLDPEAKAHLFEPFFTTKKPGRGTGLGLSTVYGIIRQSGGHILVDSTTGKGTTFRIFLPQHRLAAAAAGATEYAPAYGRGTETVLVVEDEAEVRNIVVWMLRNLGYTVLEAAGGKDALDLATRPDSRVDLVLTDVVMPGMSGHEVIERLKAVQPGLKALFMSGYTERADADRSEPNHIQKPFSAGALAAKIREILDRP